MFDETTLIALLVQKLGGEVTITRAEILATESLELEREDPIDFTVAMRLRVRDSSVVDGELVDEGEHAKIPAEIEAS